MTPPAAGPDRRADGPVAARQPRVDDALGEERTRGIPEALAWLSRSQGEPVRGRAWDLARDLKGERPAPLPPLGGRRAPGGLRGGGVRLRARGLPPHLARRRRPVAADRFDIAATCIVDLHDGATVRVRRHADPRRRPARPARAPGGSSSSGSPRDPRTVRLRLRDVLRRRHPRAGPGRHRGRHGAIPLRIVALWFPPCASPWSRSSPGSSGRSASPPRPRGGAAHVGLTPSYAAAASVGVLLGVLLVLVVRTRPTPTTSWTGSRSGRWHGRCGVRGARRAPGSGCGRTFRAVRRHRLRPAVGLSLPRCGQDSARDGGPAADAHDDDDGRHRAASSAAS